LPKYGGKGMYGENVHKAVHANKETETGITVHFVNENYDDGDIIEQQKVEIIPTDTHETIAQKVHALEYQYFPQIIEKIITGLD
jgi:phosphoribosylglycinamide formyltransferase-1